MSEIKIYVEDARRMDEATSLARKMNLEVTTEEPGLDDLVVKYTKNEVILTSDGLEMSGDFSRMVKRVERWQHELLVKACKLKDEGAAGKNAGKLPLLMDCTAGLGEDSLLLAASGFRVNCYERDAVIAALLKDAVRRGKKIPECKEAAGRMQVFSEDSVDAMNALADKIEELGDSSLAPDVIYLDPMFPGREKSALIKKKFQLIHMLEKPAADEEEMLSAAMRLHPKKIVIKRPPKGPYLAGKKPGFSFSSKAVRFDCIVL